ncbi:MAG: Blue-light-activated protein [Syntrophorhabdus sp. PtaU1.Bin153]|nr:MAG: Blue-light-activated protein [Syntrophorhabdus sp. PtaU1.Bin153]
MVAGESRVQDKYKTKEELLKELAKLRKNNAELQESLRDLKQGDVHIRRLASFPDLNPNPVLEVDSSGEVTFFNQATEKALQDLGKSLGDIKAFLPEGLADILRAWHRKKKLTLTREVTIGDRVFNEYIYFAPRYNVARIYVSEITEHRRMQEKTRELLNTVQDEKSRLSALLNSIQDEVWFADTKRRFTLVNPSAAKEFSVDASMKGIDVEGLDHALEVYYPDGGPRPVEEAPSLRALRGEVVTREEELIRTPVKGDVRYREVNSAPVRDSRGAVIGSVSVVRDITDRKRTEEALRRYTAIQEGINRVLKAALTCETEEELGVACLKVSEELTQSRFGFIGEIDEDGLKDIAISDPGWQACKMSDTTGHRQPPAGFKIHGIYGRVLLDGKSLFTNDPVHHPDSIGLPDGHPALTAFLGVPLIREGRTIGMIAVGNRQGGYSQVEQESLETLAPAIVEAFMRKRAEEALRKAYDELELRVQERTAQLKRQAELLDLAHDAVILSDREGTITFWNNGAEKTYGFTREEALGKSIHALLRTKSDMCLRGMMDRLRGRGHWEGELVHTCKDGREVTVHSRCALRYDEVSGAEEIMEVNRDITLRKEAEEALRVMGEYNRSLIEASVDPLVAINPEGRISDVNIATERITGYSREKLIGTDFSSYFTDPGKAKAGYQLVFQEGIVKDYELEIRHRDGRVTPVLYNASVYRDDAGHVIGVFAAAHDISEVKRAAAALAKSEETARARLMEIETYYDMTPIGLCILDRELHYVKVNRKFAEMDGLPVEAHAGRTVREVVPAVADMAEEMARRIVETGESVSNIESVVERTERPGMGRTFTTTWFPFKGTSGQVTSIGVMVEEISEKRRLEERVRQAQKMEAIGTLAGGIAHDFNNILAAIIGFSEMVEEDLPPESPGFSRIQRVLSAASRGRDLVRQILAFSRKTGLTRKTLSLSPLVEDTIQLLRASIPSSIEIRLDMKATKDTVLGFSAELQQILMNLATNASFAMREKGGILDIAVTNIDFEPDSPVLDEDIEPGEYIQLVVTDTGTGMSSEVKKRLFEPFFTTKGPGEGTGMGLAVVYGIVKSLGGTIAVESELGAGSTFRVFLPVARTEEEPEDRKVQQAPGGSERILFVDDEELLMEWGQATLERLGYSVTALTDPTEALKLFSSDSSRFDLIITDQTMPNLTGLNLARKLLALRKDIPIILCTGYSDSVSPRKVKDAGIKEFLMKPVDKQQLAEAIRRALQI